MELSKEKIIALLSDYENEPELLKQADQVRHDFVGDEVHLRGLIEFSNICRNNCCYCGIRRDNKLLKRYRLEPDELIETARKAANIGFKTIVMQSGEDLYFTKDVLPTLLKKLKNLM